MAVVGGRSGAVGQDSDFLLHPELLSRDFLLLSLEQQDNDLKPIAEVIENYPQRKEDQVNLEVMVWPPQNTNLNISDYQSKNIVVKDAVGNKEKLTEIFVQHAMPLPQRQLPNSRWGKLMESKRGVKKLEEPHKKSAENIRKRPLIVFDGTSTSTSIKVKKTENGDATQRLHQSCTEKTSTPVRSGAVPTSPVSHYNSSTPCKETKDPTGNHEHLSSGPGSNTETVKVKTQSPVSGNIVKIKRAAPKEDSDVTNDGKPTEAKKKIQHVTWP